MKKVLSVFIAAFVLMSAVNICAAPLNIPKEHFKIPTGATFEEYKKKCGDNLVWSLQDGVLTIDGVGDMYNYDSEDSPWYEKSADIEKVILGDFVSFIGNYAFYNCDKLNEINIPDAVTEIGYNAFKNCYSLKSIVVPDTVSVIGSGTFEGCVNLKNIILPKNLKKIYPYVFAECGSLQKLTINEGVSSIDEGAFVNCLSLESVYIPESVVSVGTRAFYGCKMLKNVVYAGSKEKWENVNVSSGNACLLECNIEFLQKEENIYYECPHCGKLTAEDEVMYDSFGEMYCSYCKKNLSWNKEVPDNEEEISEEKEESEETTQEETEKTENFDEDVEETPQEETEGVDEECCEETQEEPEEIFEDEQTNYEMSFIASSWAIEEVRKAYGNNLIPEEMLEAVLCDNITREEFAAIAVKLYEAMGGCAEYTDIQDTPFLDCREDSEYIDYIGAAYAMGITKGKTINLFAPYDLITREQMATMLYRVMKLAEEDGYCRTDVGFNIYNVRKFYDDSDISDYAKESVYYMAECGIIRGVDGANFAPKNSATREQAIIISNRTIEELN